MSRASKLTLLGTSLFAVSTVLFVHWRQKADQAVSMHPIPHHTLQQARGGKKKPTNPPAQAMHQGVIRDLEQQRLKRERQADFDMQRALEAEYKKEQTVRDSTHEMTTTGSSGGAGGAGGGGGAGT